jgi:RimJ/RimL family protein N-acetyltransferase
MRCDPAMMAELGGPLPREGIEEKVARDAAEAAADHSWIKMIVPDEAAPGVVAGSVVLWSHDDSAHDGRAHDGRAHDGRAHDGRAHDGRAHDGRAHDGRAHDGAEPVSEIGWMVLPEFQGRGLAKRAVRMLLEQAREDGRWGPVHAFPGVTNGPSNGICRSLGFHLLGERETEFAGQMLRTNDWVIDPRDLPDLAFS